MSKLPQSSGFNARTTAIVGDEQLQLQPYRLSQYLIGYGSSLLLTLVAYALVHERLLSRGWLLVIVPLLALSQFVVQMFYFLHVGREFKPRWKLFVFVFMTLIVVILVAGSIWIMTNLNYHMQSPAQMQQYLNSQDGL